LEPNIYTVLAAVILAIPALLSWWETRKGRAEVLGVKQAITETVQSEAHKTQEVVAEIHKAVNGGLSQLIDQKIEESKP